MTIPLMFAIVGGAAKPTGTDPLNVIGFVSGWAVALVTIALALCLYLRRTKVLKYAVVASQRFAATSLRKPTQLQVLYNGESVSDVYLLGVVFRNIGITDIEQDDFVEGPLRLELCDATDTAPGDTQSRPRAVDMTIPTIIGAEVVRDPDRWQQYVAVEKGAVLIHPCYFERIGVRARGRLALQLVVIDYSRQRLRIEQRLRNGVIRGSDAKAEEKRSIKVYVGAGVAFIGFVIFARVGPDTHSGTLREPYLIIVSFGLVLSLLIIAITLVWQIVATVRTWRQQRLFQ